MNLSVSNIAWAPSYDRQMYQLLASEGYSGVEIAPVRTFPTYPDGDEEAAGYLLKRLDRYGLTVSSIQSILFGKTERLFGSEEERRRLSLYIQQAMDLAAALNCHNLVFGSPKNRIIFSEKAYSTAIGFFKALSDYAEKKGTVLSMEPNPAIYGTNFINTTQQAFELAKEVNHPCFKVNVDLGTIIQNRESLKTMEENIQMVNHVHISEPNLEPIVKRNLHKELCELLKQSGYSQFISIEMKECGHIDRISAILRYIRDIFGDGKS